MGQMSTGSRQYTTAIVPTHERLVPHPFIAGSQAIVPNSTLTTMELPANRTMAAR